LGQWLNGGLPVITDKKANAVAILIDSHSAFETPPKRFLYESVTRKMVDFLTSSAIGLHDADDAGLPHAARVPEITKHVTEPIHIHRGEAEGDRFRSRVQEKGLEGVPRPFLLSTIVGMPDLIASAHPDRVGVGQGITLKDLCHLVTTLHRTADNFESPEGGLSVVTDLYNLVKQVPRQLVPKTVIRVTYRKKNFGVD
jgi:hypothetical protein